MAVTIISKQPAPGIDHVIEVMHDGRRYRWTRYRYQSGHVHDQFEEVVNSNRPFLFIPSGPDVDEIAVRDLVQSAEGRPPPVRESRPDVQKLYREFNEQRAAELAGRRHYRVDGRKGRKHD